MLEPARENKHKEIGKTLVSGSRNKVEEHSLFALFLIPNTFLINIPPLFIIFEECDLKKKLSKRNLRMNITEV
jgi:hypothetical protein